MLNAWLHVSIINFCIIIIIIITCFIKIQIGLTFLVPADPGCPGKEAVKWVSISQYYASCPADKAAVDWLQQTTVKDSCNEKCIVDCDMTVYIVIIGPPWSLVQLSYLLWLCEGWWRTDTWLCSRRVVRTWSGATALTSISMPSFRCWWFCISSSFRFSTVRLFTSSRWRRNGGRVLNGCML